MASCAEADVPTCRYFNTEEGCRYGNTCWFSHVTTEKRGEICRHFQRTGWCRFGDGCWYEHPSDPDNDQASSSLPQPSGKPEFESLTCGQCKEVFSETEDTSAEEALKTHIQKQLVKGEKLHIKVLRDLKLKPPIGCPSCKRLVLSHHGLVQHIAGKATSTKPEGTAHKDLLKQILQPFIDRDKGNITTSDLTEELSCILKVELNNNGEDGSDEDWTDDDSDVDVDVDDIYQLECVTKVLLGIAMNGDKLSDSDDEGGMCGFTGCEVEELMSQGVKPWDDDAWGVMAVLNGDYY